MRGLIDAHSRGLKQMRGSCIRRLNLKDSRKIEGPVEFLLRKKCQSAKRAFEIAKEQIVYLYSCRLQ